MKYDDLLREAEKLYTNIINENNRLIECMKKEL